MEYNMDSYLIAKTLHIFGVVIFLGNIIVTAVWKILAEHTQNTIIVAYSQRLVILTDFIFTATGATLIYVTGEFFLANHFREAGNTNWLSWGQALFVLSALLWLTVLIPIQVKQAKLAKAFKDKDVIPNNYRKLSMIWNAVGSIATILPIATLYFMVVKPT